MEKRQKYILTACGMCIVAFIFIVFALNTPQASFPWNNEISYIIYVSYIVVTFIMFRKGLKK